MSRNRRFIVGNSVIVGLAMLAGLGIVRAAPRSDTAITEDANTALHKTPGLRGSAILLETEQGRVTLRGSVAGEKERERAGKAVAAINGVTEVQNLLKVGDDAPFATETLNSPVRPRGTVPPAAVHPLTQTPFPASPGTPYYDPFTDRAVTRILDYGLPYVPETVTVPDAEIRRNVERALLDLNSQVNGGVEVLVSEGVVRLRGVVPTWDGNNDRMHATRSVPGVRSIVNDLQVANAAYPSSWGP